jgi:hypothetical protein
VLDEGEHDVNYHTLRDRMNSTLIKALPRLNGMYVLVMSGCVNIPDQDPRLWQREMGGAF